MPYATIDEILRQVPADNPGSPTGFPDFDPEDTKAWAYFVYVYLDASQSDGYGRPCFLPRYGRKAGSGESVWYENVIEWEGGAANPFKEKFAPDYDKMHRIGMIKLIFNYINNLVREWHYGYDGKSDRKMGFYIKNRSREIYIEYLRRVDKARDVAWRKVMQYSGEMLYSYSREHVDSGTRQYKVQAENGEALILPALALLFAKVNREWNEVFSQDLKITSGYRTFNQQQNLYEKLKKEEEETGRKRYVALHSTHVCGAAIDVVPSPGLCGHYG
ncbi:D-alanyl-D-alanine carboxypeptidase family protein, partial [candidate division WOR-3 bacterium]|nr:D-alanyl-D-alanine carboxypeptidase family protein [candidate division WOR-3 bacterium]